MRALPDHAAMVASPALAARTPRRLCIRSTMTGSSRTRCPIRPVSTSCPGGCPVRCLLSDIVCAGYSFPRLLHSRPDGTFSEDDQVARPVRPARVRRRPAGQAIIVRSSEHAGAVDAGRTATLIACARLRGESSDRIVAELRPACSSIMDTRQARLRAYGCPIAGPLDRMCTPAQEQLVLDACPAASLHPACLDWMLDLAREAPTPNPAMTRPRQ